MTSFTCNTNYTWDGDSCEADIQVTNCSGLPTNTHWNTVNSITQTWNGTSWLPLEVGSFNMTSSTTTCNYECDTNYTWNGSTCVADTQTENCTGTIPSNATASTSSIFTQTWNGTIWSPLTGIWLESHAYCDFDCDTNYTWNGSICEANTQSINCGGSIPSNASATTPITYLQTWNGSIWTPITLWLENQVTCDFSCDTNYTWNGTSCEADIQACSVTNGSGTQIWNGTGWEPCDVSSCNSGYTLSGGSCIVATIAYTTTTITEWGYSYYSSPFYYSDDYGYVWNSIDVYNGGLWTYHDGILEDYDSGNDIYSIYRTKPINTCPAGYYDNGSSCSPN